MADYPTNPERYICIHGHFYQPPRENPWLETVEVEDSAAPYHDWNERITAECYAPNGASRITERREPDHPHHEQLLAGSASTSAPPCSPGWRKSAPHLSHDPRRRPARALRYGGHGSAMAQVYNHIIMPLANTRDAAPRSAGASPTSSTASAARPKACGWPRPPSIPRRPRSPGAAGHPVHHPRAAPVRPRSRARGDHRAPALDRLDGAGRSLDRNPRRLGRPHPSLPGATRRRPQHRRLLLQRTQLARHRLRRPAQHRRDLRLAPGARPRPQRPRSPQLVHVATDGESYGHHHRHGEMALAYALHCIEERSWPSSPTTASSCQVPARVGGRDRRRTPPGAAPTASSAGAPTAAATAARRAGTSVARAPARGPRLAARSHRPAQRKPRRRPAQRSLGRARRLHRGHPRPLGQAKRKPPSSSFSPPTPSATLARRTNRCSRS